MQYSIFLLRMAETNNASPIGMEIGHRLAFHCNSRMCDVLSGQRPKSANESADTAVTGEKVFITSFNPPLRQASINQNGMIAIPICGLIVTKNKPHCGGRINPKAVDIPIDDDM